MENTQEAIVTENKPIEQPKNIESAPIVQQENPQETQQEINWRKFREQREVDRKQKEAAEKRATEKDAEAQALKAAMEAILNKKSTNSVDNNQYISEEDISEDQRIHKKIEEALTLKEREYEERRRQKEQVELPQRLNSAYKDFNQVCSSENLDYLEFHHPEVAKAFRNQPDGFDKWADIYAVIKKFVPNVNNKKEQSKAEKNFNKPQSMAVSGSTQTGDGAPIYLDDKRRADNWARMQKVMKGGR